MLASKTCEKMLKTYFVCVYFFITINANSIKRSVAVTDLVNNTMIETSPSLPLDQFANKYYFLEGIFEGNYFQAIQFCNFHDMTLLSIETKDENDFLWESLRSYLGAEEYHFWTSGTVLSNEHWVWLSTGKPVLYTNWSPNEPNNAGGNEKCLEVTYSPDKKALMWNDHGCTVQNFVICEISVPKITANLLTSLSSCNLTLINVPAA